jgi:hypothetical protein
MGAFKLRSHYAQNLHVASSFGCRWLIKAADASVLERIHPLFTRLLHVCLCRDLEIGYSFYRIINVFLSWLHNKAR